MPWNQLTGRVNVNLAQLIRSRKSDLGLSNEGVAERARAAGEKLKANTVGSLATREIKDMPATETIRGLAAGLGVPEDEVVEAAMESVGLKVRRLDDHNQAFMALMEDADKEAINAALEAARKAVEPFTRD
jgi:transcriptional regulator with XRE-family HTH domain